MATPLQALERMLLSQERREQSRVEESLGKMQLAQQAAIQKQQLEMSQRKQDIEEELKPIIDETTESFDRQVETMLGLREKSEAYKQLFMDEELRDLMIASEELNPKLA